MKEISPSLTTHLERDVTTLCTCWKVTRTDGQIFSFTDLDIDVVFDGRTYKAATGYNRTAVASDESMNVDNLDLIGILADDSISENDLRNGLFDYATVQMFLLNWADPSSGAMVIRSGIIGETIITPTGIFKAELRGLAVLLTYNLGEVYQPTCRADLGDSRCKISLGPLTQSGAVSAVADRRTFSVTGLSGVAEYFDGGVVTWTSGPNNGKRIEVLSWDGAGNLSVFLPPPYLIQVGHTFNIYPGCDKTRTMKGCLKFNNVINFHGEPDIPGVDEVMRFPDQA